MTRDISHDGRGGAVGRAASGSGLIQKVQEMYQNDCGWLESKLKLERARVEALLAEFDAEMHNSHALDAANRRLKRLLRKS